MGQQTAAAGPASDAWPWFEVGRGAARPLARWTGCAPSPCCPCSGALLPLLSPLFVAALLPSLGRYLAIERPFSLAPSSPSARKPAHGSPR